MSVRILAGDCRDMIAELVQSRELVDSIVTDPPYHLISIVKRFGKTSLDNENDSNARRAKAGSDATARLSRGFMGQEWDGGDVAFDPNTWDRCFDILKPGGHLVAFGGTRTYHRMACAIEDAGFEIRDQLGWIYGSGFPKSHDVAKGIDAKLKSGKARTEDIRRLNMGENYEPSGRGRVNYDNGGGSQMNGATGEYQPATPEAAEWEGWGTALKPAWEPIVLARKPLEGTVAANVLQHGTGALNIDGCRIEGADAEGGEYKVKRFAPGASVNKTGEWKQDREFVGHQKPGRWPANIVHDGSDEVVGQFPSEAGAAAPVTRRNADKFRNTYGAFKGDIDEQGSTFRGDSGSAARFFYCAKADKTDRAGSKHPTVKPVDLIRWLVRLVTPPGGTVLDPFAGSGTTGEAALMEGMKAILIERSPEYVADIEKRMAQPIQMGGLL